MFVLRTKVWLTLLLCAATMGEAGRAEPLGIISLDGRQFNLSGTDGLRAMQHEVQAKLATNPPAHLRRGLNTMNALATHALTGDREREQQSWSNALAEVAHALQNSQRPPTPPRIDLFQLPFIHHHYFSAAVGLGERPARNLTNTLEGNDLSRLDPLPSTFWVRPTNIAGENLLAGFGRAASPQHEDKIWKYSGPKTGRGGNGGFDAVDGGVKIRVKFGETHSEPFVARLFHALGYHVDPTDFSPGLKIHYDRRLFTEFNSRQPLDTKLTALGVLPVWTIHFQPVHDPVRFIATAVMKDGSRRTAAEMAQTLLLPLFETNFESQIDYLITVPANVQIKDPHEKNIGPWDFGQLGHEHHRELRGAGLLAAWLGWFDSRSDNTRLRVALGGDRAEVKHVFADLGGGLGRASGWTGWHGEAPDDFPDFFTQPEIRQGKGRMTLPFRIVNFQPIEPTPAFREMTKEDARWMARLIAQLDERQIVDALHASGFSAPEVETYRRKLLARREKMLHDLQLR